MTTCKQEIIKCLALAKTPVAIHEFSIPIYSQNNIATRLSEMAREGVVVGTVRPGKQFKEWALVAKLELIG